MANLFNLMIKSFGLMLIIPWSSKTLRYCLTFPYWFLVQSFKETLQYCDEWRKFTSVSQSVSHSVNFPGGSASFEHVA